MRTKEGLLEALKNIRNSSRGKAGCEVAAECIKLVEDEFNIHGTSLVKCDDCNESAEYHYCSDCMANHRN